MQQWCRIRVVPGHGQACQPSQAVASIVRLHLFVNRGGPRPVLHVYGGLHLVQPIVKRPVG